MNNTHKKIAFFGTPDFTVDFLHMLEKNGYTPSLIVTNPDKPAGRGLILHEPLPKQWAQKRSIQVLQPQKLDEHFFELLQKEQWDLFIVIAYGKIIPQNIISLPSFGTINLHYSLLPRYRGASPVEAALLHGDAETGIAIQQMQFELDSGPLLFQKRISINPTDTTPLLRNTLNKEAVQIFPDVLESIFNNTVEPQEQSKEEVSYCKKIKKEDGEITLDEDPTLLARKYRAYMPWPGLYFFIHKDGKKIRVKINEAFFEEGLFSPTKVTPENSKSLSFSDFLKKYS